MDSAKCCHLIVSFAQKKVKRFHCRANMILSRPFLYKMNKIERFSDSLCVGDLVGGSEAAALQNGNQMFDFRIK